jgi:hypothetical protein
MEKRREDGDGRKVPFYFVLDRGIGYGDSGGWLGGVCVYE